MDKDKKRQHQNRYSEHHAPQLTRRFPEMWLKFFLMAISIASWGGKQQN